MNGIEMLMKSMGLDPEQLKQQFGGAMVQMQNRIQGIESALQRIELRQMAIMESLQLIDPVRANQEVMTHGNVN